MALSPDFTPPGTPPRTPSPVEGRSPSPVLDPVQVNRLALSSIGEAVLKLRDERNALKTQVAAANISIAHRDERIAELEARIVMLEQAQKTQGQAAIIFDKMEIPAEPDSIEMAMANPLLKAICEGQVEIYFWENRHTLFRQSAKLLDLLLARGSNDEETVRAIYHLAFFLSGSPLASNIYEPVRTWLLTRAVSGSFYQWEEAKQKTLFHSFSTQNNCAPEDFIIPLKHIAGVRAIKGRIPQGRELEFVRALSLKKKKTEEEQNFCNVLKATVGETLWEIVLKEPEFSINLISPKKGQKKPDFLSRDAWDTEMTTRKIRIVKIIQALEPKIPTTELTYENIPLESPSRPTDDDVVTAVEAALNHGLPTASAPTYIGLIESRLCERFKQISHLEIQNPAQFADDLHKAWVGGYLPPLLQRLFFQGEGQEAQIFAQLLYYRAALKSYTNPKFPPASLQHWNWYLSANPGDASNQIITLLRIGANHPILKGSLLTASQVVWVKSIYNLSKTGATEHIYDEPGSGKTVTAIFTLALLEETEKAAQAKLKELDEEPTQIVKTQVHFISPAVHNLEGLVCHQLPPHGREIHFKGEPDDVALLDEAHIFNPDGHIYLGSKETEPLHITATPILPDINEEAFRENQLVTLNTRLRDVTKRISALEHEKTQAAAKTKKATLDGLRKTISDQCQMFSHFILLANHMNIQKLAEKDRNRHLDRLQNYFGNKDGQIISSTEIRARITALRQAFSSTSPADRLKTIKASPEKYPANDPALLRELEKLAKVDEFLNRLEQTLTEYEDISSGRTSPTSTENTQDEIDQLKLEKTALEQKVHRMNGKLRLQSETDGKGAYIDKLKKREKLGLSGIEYVEKEESDFDPNFVAASLKERALEPTIQLIFPTLTLDDRIIASLRGTLEPTLGKDVYYIYHDSHSDEKGKDMVILPNGERKTLGEFKGKMDGKIVLIYDWTNKQGGDFGKISFASHPDHGRKISQFIYWNMGRFTPPTEHDIYQTISRRRGPKEDQPAPVIFAPQVSREEFYTLAKDEQKRVEKGWIVRYATNRIAKKLAKLEKMVAGDKDISHKRIEELSGDPQKLIHDVKANLGKLKETFRVLSTEKLDWRARKLVDSILFLERQAVSYPELQPVI